MSSASPGWKESRLTSSWQSLKHEHVCGPPTVEVPGSEAHFTGFPEIPGSKEHSPPKNRAIPQISNDEELFRNLRKLCPPIS